LSDIPEFPVRGSLTVRDLLAQFHVPLTTPVYDEKTNTRLPNDVVLQSNQKRTIVIDLKGDWNQLRQIHNKWVVSVCIPCRFNGLLVASFTTSPHIFGTIKYSVHCTTA